jgi:hypothetical protein
MRLFSPARYRALAEERRLACRRGIDDVVGTT